MCSSDLNPRIGYPLPDAGLNCRQVNSRIDVLQARVHPSCGVLRRQLPSNIFVQFLAGPQEVRTGFFGFVLRLIAQISLIVSPLALLVFFLLQFLPYHHELIAWWQRLVVVADLGLLWAFWPSVARGETTRIGWKDLHNGKVQSTALASFALASMIFSIER